MVGARSSAVKARSRDESESLEKKEDKAPPFDDAAAAFFSKLSLSSRDRALTAEDLAPTIAAMQQHLMAKNAADDDDAGSLSWCSSPSSCSLSLSSPPPSPTR
jgi:hypothetical protein